MQFQYNADYPGLSAAGPMLVESSDPVPFPTAQPIPCARITTRVFHPNRNQIATVQNVLVRTISRSNNNGIGNNNVSNDDSSNSDMSNSSSISDDDTFDSMMGTEAVMEEDESTLVQHAYWLQRTIREAIYGRVLFAVVLKRRPRAVAAADGAEWEVTSDHCAVKEMAWQHIRRERNRLAEDPIKEVSAMQHIKNWFEASKQKSDILPTSGDTSVAESFQSMRQSNIMMPLDLLTDERNLYSIMPYCDGGELFERLDLNERFSEEEARYWMDQLLNVSRVDHCSSRLL